MRMWVVRPATGDSGNPDGSYSPEEIRSGLRWVVNEILLGQREPLQGDDEAVHAFLVSELRGHGRLRQGWGVSGIDVTGSHWDLDLRARSGFLQGYLVAIWKYWGVVTDEDVRRILEGQRQGSEHGLLATLHAFLRQAAGRYSILHRMVQMSRGDIVFVPRMPDDKSFAVARVSSPGYEFENRSTQPATWMRDFGHIRRVSDVRVYQYGANTLLAGEFGAPYRHAVDPVSSRQQVFARFLRAHYGG